MGKNVLFMNPGTSSEICKKHLLRLPAQNENREREKACCRISRKKSFESSGVTARQMKSRCSWPNSSGNAGMTPVGMHGSRFCRSDWVSPVMTIRLGCLDVVYCKVKVPASRQDGTETMDMVVSGNCRSYICFYLYEQTAVRQEVFRFCGSCYPVMVARPAAKSSRVEGLDTGEGSPRMPNGEWTVIMPV